MRPRRRYGLVATRVWKEDRQNEVGSLLAQGVKLPPEQQRPLAFGLALYTVSYVDVGRIDQMGRGHHAPLRETVISVCEMMRIQF